MGIFKHDLARRPPPLNVMRREDYRRIELCSLTGEYVYVVTAKTNAERQREFRARKATEQNATEVRGIFAHPDDHQAIKDEAAKIARRRLRAQKRAAP